jgi:hypothetical protein
MKQSISLSLAIFSCLCLALATERHALAYIDPGTGFVALQSFFAGLAAFGYFMRRRIGGLFGRKPAEEVVMPNVNVAKDDSERSAA